MAANAHSLKPPSRLLLALELSLSELGGFVASLPLLAAATPRGDGHPVLVLPGCSPRTARRSCSRGFLNRRGIPPGQLGTRTQLRSASGHRAQTVDRVKQLADEHGRKASRAGGQPRAASTLASPPRCCPTRSASSRPLEPVQRRSAFDHCVRLYELTSGHKVDDRESHMGGAIAEPLQPVPTTAIYSRSDGICALAEPRQEKEGPITENISRSR